MNHLKNVKIKNFKSIEGISFNCKRVNIFLGEPNVGKSNILEALALFSAPFSQVRPSQRGNQQIFAWDQIRYSAIRNLFFFQDTSKPIKVITDKGVALMQMTIPQFEDYEFFIAENEDAISSFKPEKEGYPLTKNAENFTSTSKPNITPNFYLPIHKNGNFNTTSLNSDMLAYRGFIKKYSFNETYFKEEDGNHNRYPYFLLPCYGSNVFTIVQANHELADLVSSFFEKYDLEFIFIQEKGEYVIQRRKGRIGYQLPYDSIADTLQRIIFHLAAIYSNKDSVLIFEEPEAHSFPDYIQLLASKIIESETNQFFIATHSPYLVQKLLQGLDHNELQVNVVGYKDHQTLVKEIPGTEVDNMIDKGSDIFFNLPQF